MLHDFWDQLEITGGVRRRVDAAGSRSPPVSTPPVASPTSVRPFTVNVPEEALTDLRRRIAATRWLSRELVDDRSQGVQLATLQELARYWANDYDWRRCESKLNARPQFKSEID